MLKTQTKQDLAVRNTPPRDVEGQTVFPFVAGGPARGVSAGEAPAAPAQPSPQRGEGRDEPRESGMRGPGQAPAEAGVAQARRTRRRAKSTTNCYRILQFLRARGAGGATREEIAAGTGITICSVAPCVGRMLGRGRRRFWAPVLRVTGRRPTATGCLAEVVVAIQFDPERS
jgi:hypothetical protein